MKLQLSSSGRKRKLTEADCQEIRRMYAVKDKPWSVTQTARSFNVSTGIINKVLNGNYKPLEIKK